MGLSDLATRSSGGEESLKNAFVSVCNKHVCIRNDQLHLLRVTAGAPHFFRIRTALEIGAKVVRTDLATAGADRNQGQSALPMMLICDIRQVGRASICIKKKQG